MRLAEVIGRFLGKVEIVLAGADEDLRDGEEALARGDAMGARTAARRVLTQAPDSPLGLALLADACELGHLDAELALTLEELARRAPSQAEVWVRLAHARQATGAQAEDVRDSLVRALAVADSGTEARIAALMGLADLDLAQGDGARAELWIERLALVDSVAPAVAVRSAEARLLRGDAAGAKEKLDGVQLVATDGRGALARGRALAMLADGTAFTPLIRAMVLDVPGASEALSSAMAHVSSDVQTRTRVRSVVDAKGEQALARWRAAFARAEGARDAARRALRDAVATGDAAASRPLLDAAIEDRDLSALEEALQSLAALPRPHSDLLLADARRLASAISAESGSGSDGSPIALDSVATIAHPRLVPWASATANEIVRAWIPASGAPAAWAPLLARLDARAHAVGSLTSAAHVGDLAAERSRPVRLAIVGEFNAGKSTFINALIGADVAPTGVLPTTATLHHVRWGPDPFARILFADSIEPRERIVGLSDLRSTLKDLDTAGVKRVEIRLPLASLVRVEILDTPGFNAPDPGHTRVARSAFEEADAAIWLMDATQAMKNSERAVLEEARAAGIPVQMLVNKADRLSAADLARVMESVRNALESTRVGSWGPPLALSAKKALAARLDATGSGGGSALADSGWPEIETLIACEIVGRSAELKERALRRRAAVVVADLIDAWGQRDDADQAEAVAQEAHALDAAHAAARTERDAKDLADRLAASLVPSAQEWARDLELVYVGRDRKASEGDSTLARYKVDRAVSAIAPRLSRALTAMAPEISFSPEQLDSYARAAVRAAAWCSSSDPNEMLAAIARATVATLAEQLSLLSLTLPPPTGAAGVVRELQAFRSALTATGRRPEAESQRGDLHDELQGPTVVLQ